jgi:predicted DNA-binding transcriptional regulator AlpA
MARAILFTIERKADVLDRLGLSRTTLHNKIQNGLWVPPISLGARAVGFIKHETDELLTAHINGYTPTELRKLACKLIEDAKNCLGAAMSEVVEAISAGLLGAGGIGSLTAKGGRGIGWPRVPVNTRPRGPVDVNEHDSGVYYPPKRLHHKPKPNGYRLGMVSEYYSTASFILYYLSLSKPYPMAYKSTALATTVNGRTWWINSRVSGIYTTMVRSMIGQLDAMLNHHSRIHVVRFDLRQYEYSATNKRMTDFNRRLFRWLKARYGLKRVG